MVARTVRQGVTLAEVLAGLADTRFKRGRRYRLDSMLMLACVAMLCGARSLRAIADFGHMRAKTLGPLLGFGSSTPSYNNYFYVFGRLDVEAFENALATWISSLGIDASVIAVDGKTVRGSRDGDTPGLHLLTAFASNASVAMTHLPVDIKTNEARALLELLKVLPIEGTVVTGDAMFAQRDICKAITDAGGDYLVAVKDNQPGLKGDITLAFAPSVSPSGQSSALAQ